MKRLDRIEQLYLAVSEELADLKEILVQFFAGQITMKDAERKVVELKKP